MAARTQKHSHVPHARSSDPDLYYKIILFALCGYSTKGIAQWSGNVPVQTIARNLKAIRSKLSYNENYLTEVFNRFYHADSYTGKFYGDWGMMLRSLKPAQNAPLSPEQRDGTERLVRCLKECPKAKPSKKFLQDHVEIGLFNSTEFPEVFDPHNHPWPLLMPILQDIDGYFAFLKRKKSCGSCPMRKAERESMFTIFTQSPYVYLDIAFQLTQFQPKKLEDYSDHLHFAWISGCMRGIHHMTANKTALLGMSLDEQLRYSNALLLDFVDMTYDAFAGKMLPSLPLPD
jgi:hypothetical protein